MNKPGRLAIALFLSATGFALPISLQAADLGEKPAAPGKPGAVEKPAAPEKPAPPEKPAAPERVAPPEKLAPPAKLAAPRPTPLKPGEKNPVNVAAAALLLEYNKAMKEKNGEGLRDKCDYFGKEKPAGVSAETILPALERRLAPDVRADSYVKWQLLSGIEGKFPPEMKAKSLAAYRAAAQPHQHPGLAKGNLDRILNRVGIMKKEAEPDINKEFGDAITQYRYAIEPILEYRDELYTKLNPDFDVYLAGLADLYDRVVAGAPANEFWTNMSTSMRSWAITAKDPRQVKQVASVIMKIRETNADQRHRPYGKVGWTDKGLVWQTEASIRDDKSMEETATWLAEQGNNPGGGLGFKDALEEKKPKK